MANNISDLINEHKEDHNQRLYNAYYLSDGYGNQPSHFERVYEAYTDHNERLFCAYIKERNNSCA